MSPSGSKGNGEIFDVVDAGDRVIGTARRNQVHGNPALIHRVAHVLVINGAEEVFLQKRADDKDVEPGKWDTSVGGHLDSGESYGAAARRELEEELGVSGVPISRLYTYRHANDHESEFVTTYLCRYDGPFSLQKSEISDGRFWTLREIDDAVAAGRGKSLFTPNFLDELRRWRAYRDAPGRR